MVKQQMHYLGSCSDKWPMYGCEQFLAKRKKQFPLKWQKKATRLIFRIEASSFFPTYLAVCLVNFHSWEHPQPRYFPARPILKLFFICENFPSLSWSRSECEKSCWMCNCMPFPLPFFPLANSAYFSSLHTSPIFGEWINPTGDLRAARFNPSRSGSQSNHNSTLLTLDGV